MTPIKQDGGGPVTLYLKGSSRGDKFIDGEMKIGYWDIEGLATSRKLQMVTWLMKRHGVDMLVIQESHLRVAKLFRTENGRIDVIFSGATGQHYNSGQMYAAGVGLILSDRAQRTLIGYGIVSDRVLSTQLHLKSQKFTIIYVYIPQSKLSLKVQNEAWD